MKRGELKTKDESVRRRASNIYEIKKKVKEIKRGCNMCCSPAIETRITPRLLGPLVVEPESGRSDLGLKPVEAAHRVVVHLLDDRVLTPKRATRTGPDDLHEVRVVGVLRSVAIS